MKLNLLGGNEGTGVPARAPAGSHDAKMGHIEVLRGLAVVLVLLYHLRIPGAGFAYLGVDAFFVISGFLMALLYGDVNSRETILDFYRRRLSRLLPAYFVVLALTILISALVALPHEFWDASRYGYWSAVLLPNIGFWLDASYFESAYFRPMLNFWSLGVELQFYLFFPLIAICHRRWPTIVIAVSLLSLLLFVGMSTVSPKSAFFLTPCRIWQFMIGFYIARLPRLPLPRGTGEAALVLLVGLILAASWMPIGAAWLAIGTALLSGFFISAGLTPKIESSRLSAMMQVLGKYSYSIYLVHFPIIVFVAHEPFAGTNLQLGSAGAYVLVLALTAISAVALYHFVESPLRVRRTGRFVGGTIVVGALAAGAAALVATPINRAMISPAEVQAVSAWFDRLPYRCPRLGRLIHPFEKSCVIAGEGAPVALLVGDSHADVLKAVLGEEMARAGGTLRLTVDNAALGDISPASVMHEAEQHDVRLIVLHSNADHVDLEAIGRLVAMAGERGIKVALILPIPEPGFHVPKQIFSMLQAGQTVRPRRDSGAYLRRHHAILTALGRLAVEHPNLHLIYPHPMMCRPVCVLQAPSGALLFSDRGHLTQTGVRSIRPMLRQVALVATEESARTPAPVP